MIAILLLAAFAFKVTSDLSRRVVLTWFAVTPIALSLAQAARIRAHWSATNGASAPRYIIIGVNEVGFELARRACPPRACSDTLTSAASTGSCSYRIAANWKGTAKMSPIL